MNTNHNFTVKRISKEQELLKDTKPTNKYILLYRAIKACIQKHEIPHDWILPSTRVLAEELGLSRTTVIKAYELLVLEKLVISKVGSGNRVNYNMSVEELKDEKEKTIITSDNYPKISRKGDSYSKNISLLNRLPNENLAFRPGLPPVDVFPVNQWKNLLNTYWRHIKSSGLTYSNATGLIELKKSICNYLNVSRNIICSPEQIVIVSGSLQSLYLIATTLIDKGDSVVLENPVFPNVHSVFKSSEATLIPIGLDEYGIDINKLKKIKEHPKLIHVTPSNQYPMGVRMSLQRRREVLEWASQNKALVIENDYENEIANNEEAIPTIFSLDKEDRTIYMGTFNRLLHPSIRLGYMIVPKYLIRVVEALQEHSHRFVSPSIQVVMNQFIDKNYLYQHIKNCIDTAKERFFLFKKEFESSRHRMVLQDKPFSSFHVVAFFKEPVNVSEEKEIIKKLNEQGIVTFSLSKCYINKPEKQGLIIGYSAVRPSVMSRKIKKMIAVLK